MTRIGFVGLGAMGSRIAGRLLQDHQVYGTNRSAAKASELIARGMIWRGTPREVAREAEVIFSMVTDDAALEAVTSGPDGILAGLAPGQLYADMSTVSPRASRRLARSVHDLGASMLDASAVWGSAYQQLRTEKRTAARTGCTPARKVPPVSPSGRLPNWPNCSLASHRRLHRTWANAGWSADKHFDGC